MSTSTAHPRYVLLPTAAGARESEAKVRRYRLARLRIASLRSDAAGPFAHLKRSYD